MMSPNNGSSCWLLDPRNYLPNTGNLTNRILSKEGLDAIGGLDATLRHHLCQSCMHEAGCQLRLSPTINKHWLGSPARANGENGQPRFPLKKQHSLLVEWTPPEAFSHLINPLED